MCGTGSGDEGVRGQTDAHSKDSGQEVCVCVTALMVCFRITVAGHSHSAQLFLTLGYDTDNTHLLGSSRGDSPSCLMNHLKTDLSYNTWKKSTFLSLLCRLQNLIKPDSVVFCFCCR